MTNNNRQIFDNKRKELEEQAIKYIQFITACKDITVELDHTRVSIYMNDRDLGYFKFVDNGFCGYFANAIRFDTREADKLDNELYFLNVLAKIGSNLEAIKNTLEQYVIECNKALQEALKQSKLEYEEEQEKKENERRNSLTDIEALKELRVNLKRINKTLKVRVATRKAGKVLSIFGDKPYIKVVNNEIVKECENNEVYQAVIENKYLIDIIVR